MSQRRVVVTGAGVISALGKNVQEFREALFAGRPGVEAITGVDVSELRFKNAAEVRGFQPADYFDEKQILWLDRFAQFGLVAAREAVNDAGIEWTEELRNRTGVITGTSMGGQLTQDQAYYGLYYERKPRVPPGVIPRAMSNAAASHISMEYGATGPSYTMSTACSSANHAIGQAFWSVREGLIDLAITGGSEAPLVLINLKAWESMRVVSPDTCRPFSKNRSGMVLGEGGAMLVLETLERARGRGAKIYAEIIGFGMSADAHHLTQPAPAGAAKAMQAALADANLRPQQIGYVNAHGTATQANDVMETQALRIAFGEHANELAVSSTKSMHAHTLGAAGAIEAIATVLALRYGVLPPTANFVAPDPQCDLDVIPNKARSIQVEAAISNSFAFGGLNATLVFKRWNG